jgi:hypothetical protein
MRILWLGEHRSITPGRIAIRPLSEFSLEIYFARFAINYPVPMLLPLLCLVDD